MDAFAANPETHDQPGTFSLKGKRLLPKRKLALLPFFIFIICLLLAYYFYSESNKKQNDLNTLKSKETRFKTLDDTNSSAGSFEDGDLRNLEKQVADFKNLSIILLTMGSIMFISNILKFIIQKFHKDQVK